MIIFIVIVMLFFICLFVGASVNCTGLALIVWLFISVVSICCLAKAEESTDGVDNCEQLRKEIKRDNEEWYEWRHMYQEENK